MAASSRDPNDGIGLAARVILHLAGLGRLGPNDVAVLDSTQQGMVARLEVRQSSLGRVLQLLEVVELVGVERRFVVDARRRMKVYRLTELGESTARNLRRNASVPPHPAAASGWVSGRVERTETSPLSTWPRAAWRREETEADTNGRFGGRPSPAGPPPSSGRPQFDVRRTGAPATPWAGQPAHRRAVSFGGSGRGDRSAEDVASRSRTREAGSRCLGQSERRPSPRRFRGSRRAPQVPPSPWEARGRVGRPGLPFRESIPGRGRRSAPVRCRSTRRDRGADGRADPRASSDVVPEPSRPRGPCDRRTRHDVRALRAQLPTGEL
jgi:DNA-binding PadR family transcriptional regulator